MTVGMKLNKNSRTVMQHELKSRQYIISY